LVRAEQAQRRSVSFCLEGGNAETILTSQLYSSKSAAEGGIRSVQANGANDANYERKTASNDKLFFNLKAANQMYASEASRETGISSVKTNGSSTTIKDLSA
jgi:uncharacterized protein YegP (UPF0339 family)